MSSLNVDLFELFQIWNPSFRYISCAGYAPTRRRRCGWEIDGSSVEKRLKDIGNKLPHKNPTKAELLAVAMDALCHHHKRQAGDIAMKWKSLIDDLDLEDLEEQMRSTRINDDAYNPRFGGNQRREDVKRKHVEEKRQERAREEARKMREEEERKRREDSAKANIRKEQERKDREAEGERRSWRQAWTQYAEAREKFKEKKVHSSSGIPWPVKSGLCKDVTEQNVSVFYRNALPGSSTDERYKIMQRECLIWHPDKAKQLIGNLALTAAEVASMVVIARMVIQLHKEFREKRAS